MRTKIEKRIGPVPIALVAVLALAAIVSAGLWLVPGNGQTAEAQSIPSVVIDVNEAMVASTPTQMGNAAQVRSAFSRIEGDSVTYDVARIDSDMVADTNNDNDDDDIDLGTLSKDDFRATPLADDDNVGVVTLDINSANMTGTRYVYVTATYGTGDDGTAQNPVTLVFMLTVVQNPIEVRGDMVTNPDVDSAAEGVQWPDGKCTVGQNTSGDGLVTRNNEDDPPSAIVVASPTNLVSAGDCLSSDDEVNVTIFNSHVGTGALDWTTIVYVTGGDDLSGVEPALAKEGLDEHILTISPNTVGDVGEATITVTRSMSDSKGIVYLVGYGEEAGATLTAANLDDDSTTFGRDAEYVIKVVFLDPPVEKDADGNTVSMIKMSDDDLGGKASEVTATITVKDANGHPVSGFVTLVVEGPDSVVFTASNLKTHRTKLSSAGTAMEEISGLPKDEPIKIKVTATIGDLTLDEDIVRTGDADMVEATAYSCAMDRDDEDEAGVDRGVCASEIDALGTTTTSDDPKELVALGPGKSFVIGGKATDLAGNNVGSGSDLTWEIYGDADNADDAEDTLTTNSGRTNQMITVADGDDAVPGTYSLTVKSPDGEASTMIMIIVSDDASMIMVSCDPEMVTTDSGLTDCTVTVTDENGNIPSNLIHGSGDSDDDSRVLVIVRSEGASLSGVDSGGYTDLDAKGIASFSVVLHEDAREGNITVFVSTDNVGSTTLRDNTSVIYGESDVPTDPGMDGELGTVTGVITGFNRGGALQVSWTKAANASGYIIIAINVNDVNNDVIAVVLNDGDLDTQNISGLTPGATYDIYVAATASGGMNTLSEATQVMAK